MTEEEIEKEIDYYSQEAWDEGRASNHSDSIFYEDSI